VVGAHAANDADRDETERRENRYVNTGCTVIVLDASVVVEPLTNGRIAASLRRDLAGRSESFLVPHLLDIEVASALRRLMEGRRIDSYQSEQLLTGLATLAASAMHTRHCWAEFGNCGTIHSL
jgi:hypothetical protein